LRSSFHTIEGGLAKGLLSNRGMRYWNNCIKPHGGLNLENAKSLIEAYYRKMEPREELTDPSILVKKENEMIL
jgi:hypothetical protein